MKKNLHKGLFLITDFTTALFAWISFYFLRKLILNEIPEPLSWKLLGHAILIGSLWVGIYAFSGIYYDIYRKSRIKEFFRLAPIVLAGTVLIFFTLLLDDKGIKGNYTSYYKTFTAYFLIHFFYTSIFRVILLTYIKRLVKKKLVKFNSIIIGSGNNAKEIYEAVEKNQEILGFTLVGYLTIEGEPLDLLKNHLPSLGKFKRNGEFINVGKIENVIVALEKFEHSTIDEILKELEKYNVKVSIIPDIYDLILGAVKVNHVFSIPLIEINQDIIPAWQKVSKRSIDILVALKVLVIGSPFFLITSLITKLSSKGPVFYSQERIGKDGVPFRIFKFRSMYVNAEDGGPALSSSQDQRVTSWGRFMRRTKIDEFPQFYNVLIGDMSLVGPRPERQYFINQIVQVAPHYRHLHRIKPGITSLGQVKYGYAENVPQMVKRLKYDIIYIENMSLALDFQIMLHTLLVMLSGRTK